MTNTKKIPYSVLSLFLFVLIINQTHARQATPSVTTLEKIEDVLTRTTVCSPSLTLRSQALTKEQELEACKHLGSLEKHFHRTFAIKGQSLSPVKHDNNNSLRANIYRDKANFSKYAGAHFNMPTNNGGMYLEGLPDKKDNHAEFIAHQNSRGDVHNLGHEYIHYLDGRFNLYGDFCANLHDSHDPPENCAKPAPLTPYLIWWTEGIAEYISKGNDNLQAKKLAAKKSYKLSELFDTAYENNSDNTRVYSWGYLGVRFMMEKHRGKIEQLLNFTRDGDYPRCQSLMRSWGTSLDAEFAEWLDTLQEPTEK